jgi:fatty acid synthase subunit beta
MLTKDLYAGDEKKIPVVEYFGGKLIEASDEVSVDGLTVSEIDNKTIYRLSAASGTALPEVDNWMQILAGRSISWRHAFFTADVFVQGQRFQSNPMHRIFSPTPGMLVEIAYPDDPKRTTIVVKEPSHGKYVPTIEVGPISNGEISVKMIDERSASGKPEALTLRFTYHPETGYAPIREVMDARNDRIKEFYYRIWFGDEACPFDAPVTSRFEGGRATVTSEAINDFVHAVGNRGEAFVDRPGKEVFAPMDFAIVVGWKAITKPIFPRKIDGDLLKLVHMSNGFRMLPGATPLKKGDVLDTTAEVNAVINQASGKLVEVCGTITRDGTPIMEVTSQFLYRGAYTDFENTFQRKVETPVEVHLETTKDIAVLQSKEWFRLEESDTELLGQTLVFRLQTLNRYKNETVFSSVQTIGKVELELPSKEIIQVASVEYEAGASFGNPVLDYLTRNGTSLDQPVHFENPIPLHGKTPLVLKAPASNETYARVSGDYNPIHVSRVFSKYANLPGTITHGMYSSAAVRSLVETWAAENNVGRVRSFHASLVGMVLPDDTIEVTLLHVGMVSGRKIIKVEAAKAETEEKVLLGEAEIDQPSSAYIFTGQGSQEQGMGMDLYESSPVAAEVWNRADKHFLDNYGKLMSTTHVFVSIANPSPRLCHHQHCQEQPQRAHHSLRWRSWQGHPPELHVHDFRDSGGRRKHQVGEDLQGGQRAHQLLHLPLAHRSPLCDAIHSARPYTYGEGLVRGYASQGCRSARQHIRWSLAWRIQCFGRHGRGHAHRVPRLRCVLPRSDHASRRRA